MSTLLLLFLLSSDQQIPDGEFIARQVFQRDEGNARFARLKMVLRNKRGQERVREVKVYRKYFGTEKRSILFFEAPKKLRDTGFLTHDFAESEREDDQWLYLPALKKVRRISASDRGDYFLGTDFTYEDMKMESRINPDDYDSKTLREEQLDGSRVIVIEEQPVDQQTAAELSTSKRLVWVDPSNWTTLKIESWDVKGNHQRTVTMSEIRQVQGIWTTHHIHAVNHKSKHETTYTFSDVSYDVDLSEGTFARNTLRRGVK